MIPDANPSPYSTKLVPTGDFRSQLKPFLAQFVLPIVVDVTFRLGYVAAQETNLNR